MWIWLTPFVTFSNNRGQYQSYAETERKTYPSETSSLTFSVPWRFISHSLNRDKNTTLLLNINFHILDCDFIVSIYGPQFLSIPLKIIDHLGSSRCFKFILKKYHHALTSRSFNLEILKSWFMFIIPYIETLRSNYICINLCNVQAPSRLLYIFE